MDPSDIKYELEKVVFSMRVLKAADEAWRVAEVDNAIDKVEEAHEIFRKLIFRKEGEGRVVS